uniref:Uncharacterized protein n=1 Tax=Plectus sambesii TaxID=2011161 RepID=A0A914UK43_9BILA
MKHGHDGNWLTIWAAPGRRLINSRNWRPGGGPAPLATSAAFSSDQSSRLVFVEGMRCALVVLRIAFLLLVVAAYQLIAPLFPHWLPPPSHIRAVRRSEMDNLAESVEHYD